MAEEQRRCGGGGSELQRMRKLGSDGNDALKFQIGLCETDDYKFGPTVGPLGRPQNKINDFKIIFSFFFFNTTILLDQYQIRWCTLFLLCELCELYIRCHF